MPPSLAPLRLFLAYAPGCGKTTRLLEEARALQEAGRDVVVAAAQPRGRREVLSRLEGLEVAFIVLTFGLNRGEFALSAIGAFLAFAIVALIGALVHRPLARVPENAIKFSVGILLVSFGTFWGGEGLGVEWSLQDGMIPVLVVLYTLIALGLVSYLRPATGHVELAIEGAHE